MQIKYTNFEGDWEADCRFCGSPQRDHQVNLGEFDAIRFVHRQPCRAEQRHITKQHMIRANGFRAVITVYEIVEYLWNKIPFKEEVNLLFRIIRRSYLGMRGLLHYWLTFEKTK